MDLDFKQKMIVREAMSSPVITVNEKQNVVEAAKTMRYHRVGALVVVNIGNQPLGIVTERDLVYRVIGEDTVPRNVSVKNVMSSPLEIVDPETTLEDAINLMTKKNIRRLGVVYKGRLEGVISDKDIIRLIPALIEIVRESSRIQSGNEIKGPSLVGYCNRCGIYSTNLRSLHGDFLCEDCRVESD
jgi:CBS domain-containing protein